MKACCFTGHRKIPPQYRAKIYADLQAEIIRLHKSGVVYFLCGGALGFDTLAAQAVLELRRKYPKIKLLLILPCKDQTRGWPAADRIIYENIKKACDGFRYVCDRYTQGCMQIRNRRLVECSTCCVCYLTRRTGGTAYTVAYAKQKGLKIINLADQIDLR